MPFVLYRVPFFGRWNLLRVVRSTRNRRHVIRGGGAEKKSISCFPYIFEVHRTEVERWLIILRRRVLHFYERFSIRRMCPTQWFILHSIVCVCVYCVKFTGAMNLIRGRTRYNGHRWINCALMRLHLTVERRGGEGKFWALMHAFRCRSLGFSFHYTFSFAHLDRDNAYNMHDSNMSCFFRRYIFFNCIQNVRTEIFRANLVDSPFKRINNLFLFNLI